MAEERQNAGFTLLELLVVMAIMVILTVISLASYRGMKRSSDLRGAVAEVRSTMMLARQQAVFKRQYIQINFIASDTGTNSVQIYSGANLIHKEIVLPSSIKFDGSPASIKFSPAGGAGVSSVQSIVLKEKDGMGSSLLSESITIWPLTGISK